MFKRCVRDYTQEILVFDQDFIEESVFTGQEITTENRRGLYVFALGDAVEMQKSMELMTQKTLDAGRVKNEKERNLQVIAQPFPLDDFIKLEREDGLDKRLQELKRQHTAIALNAKIQARSSLSQLSQISFNSEEVFALFQRGLPDVQADAEAIVKTHILKAHDPSFEGWLNKGREYVTDNDCPYCGQSLSGLELISAYQTYFNTAYNQLKRDIATLESLVVPNIRQASSAFKTIVGNNKERIAVWADLVEVADPFFDLDSFHTEIEACCSILQELLEKKKNEPLRSIEIKDEQKKVEEALEKISGLVGFYNNEINGINHLFDEKKAQLGKIEQTMVANEIQRIETHLRRFTPDVVKLVEEYVEAVKTAKSLAKQKEDERKEHDKEMEKTLERYQNSINEYLQKFRAGFSIVSLEGTHAAGREPRTSYALKLRGSEIKALQRNDDPAGPCVAYALSEGDKRSLALAFFFARLKSDKEIASRILVFDDPVTSLDYERKDQTAKELLNFSKMCEQVIILSHDSYFLRQVMEMAKSEGADIRSIRIKSVGNDYSSFDECNLEELCRSPYRRHYELLKDFLDFGLENSDPRTIAQSLRPLVEGYYKHRYPELIKPEWTFGKIVEAIRNSSSNSPLFYLMRLTDLLENFNEFTNRHHHSLGDEYADSELITEKDLRHYAHLAFDLIHSDGSNFVKSDLRNEAVTTVV